MNRSIFATICLLLVGLTIHAQSSSNHFNAIEACRENRAAPPVSSYSWAPDTMVRVYFMRGMFTPQQRHALFAAMLDWNSAGREVGAGVTFVDAGDTDQRMGCDGCLTVARQEVNKHNRKYYAYFFSLRQDGNGWLQAASIELDFATTDPVALRGFMGHELGHGMGLWDCTNCKKHQTIMNGFPHINRHNGLTAPSRCDLEVVRRIYNEQRRTARTTAQSATGVVGR